MCPRLSLRGLPPWSNVNRKLASSAAPFCLSPLVPAWRLPLRVRVIPSTSCWSARFRRRARHHEPYDARKASWLLQCRNPRHRRRCSCRLSLLSMRNITAEPGHVRRGPARQSTSCTQRPRNHGERTWPFSTRPTAQGPMGSMMPAKHSDCCERRNPRHRRRCIRRLSL